MQHQTNWDQLEQTAQNFINSRWPYIGEGLLALIPVLKAETSLHNALIFTSMGTLIIEAINAPKLHIEVQPSGEYKIYWYGENPLDYEGDVSLVVPLEQVMPTVLSHLME